MSTSIGNLDADRYYQLFFITVWDPATWSRYCELAAPVVTPYGGRVDRQIVPDKLHGEGLAPPELVNLASSSSRALHEAFGRDERFLEIVHLRAESTTLASVQGPSLRGGAGEGDPGGRLYLVELARFGPGGKAAYEAYEAEAEPVLARYGYRVERQLAPERASGLPFVPDVVKVAYFDAPDGMDRAHRDPAHARLEAELYPAAVGESIWIVGRARALG